MGQTHPWLQNPPQQDHRPVHRSPPHDWQADALRACGIRHVKTVPAYAVDEIEKTLKEYLKLDEPAVLITREECALLPAARKRWVPLEVIADACNGCTLCFRIGCPAILKSDELDEKTGRPKALIDTAACTGCEVCAQICPRDAIKFRTSMN